MKVNSLLKDITGASRVTKRRRKAFDEASTKVEYSDPIGNTAKDLHPGRIKAALVDIKEIYPNVKQFTFKSDKMPYFKAGSYMVLTKQIGNSIASRPYSISSSPNKALKDKEIEIIIKSVDDGFFSLYMNEQSKLNDEFEIEVGLGEFTYDSIRDSKNIVGLVGGSGITPLLSMARFIKENKLDLNLTIIYGCQNQNEVILKEELESLVQDNISLVLVMSDDESYNGEKGFIDRGIIKKYSKEDSTYFVCGPQAMYNFVYKELKALQIEDRRIRMEVFGQAKDVSKLPDYPVEHINDIYDLEINQGIHKFTVKAKASDSISTTLEKNGIYIHTKCRSGVCGACRIKVLEGDFYIDKTKDVRRSADKEFNYVHSCVTYPLSNMRIKLNIQ